MFKKPFLTLGKAIKMGEYEPEVLDRFDEFKKLSRYTQYQLIREALKNREKQLRMHWAEINNQLDFSKKPHLLRGLRKIEQKLEELAADEEWLLLEYSE